MTGEIWRMRWVGAAIRQAIAGLLAVDTCNASCQVVNDENRADHGRQEAESSGEEIGQIFEFQKRFVLKSHDTEGRKDKC